MATVDPSAVAEAIATLRARIDVLAGGRTVHVVAVTKGFGSDAIDAAVAAGCTMVGESYAQELLAKIPDVREPRPAIHFIGQLQSNKVRQLAGVVDVWETVDRLSLADEIARRAPGARVLVQVNATAETGKGGCAPDAVRSLVDRCRGAGLDVDGLMTIGPTSQDEAGTRAAFALVRGLVDDLGVRSCSMGMSGDYELAVAGGATHVRVGSALFGQRPHPRAAIG